MTVHISSSAQWRQITGSSSIVVTDFYADWCGPCKTIAPTFESLSTKYSKPNRITFAKVNVDTQPDVAQQYSVRAMPTFLILRNGSVIKTIQGANPPALTAAVEEAVKLAGPAAPGVAFKTPGHTLGGSSSNSTGRVAGRQSLGRPPAWDLNSFINAFITFFGLYFTSLFSLDPYMAAQNSKYNIRNPAPAGQPIRTTTGGQKLGGGRPKTSYSTLADLGNE